jgi:hypothetical protein
MKANALSHTHSQFASANATPKIAKEYVLPTLTFELNNKHRKTKQNVKALLTTTCIKHSYYRLS